MKRFSIYALLILFAMAMAACGNGEAEDPAAEETVDDGVRTIEIIGIDDMKFVVESDAEGIRIGDQIGQNYLLEEIHASPGEEIRIRLHTVSTLPKSAMAHNFALLELDADTDAFVNASIMAADNEYIAPDMDDMLIITTAMLGGGETDTITFTAPEEPGEYDYVCTFPGHYAADMRGILRVE